MNLFKIALSIFIFFILNISYADSNIKLYVENSEIIEWETFNLKVDITTSSTWSIELTKIQWIDNFEILWQSKNSNISIINWVYENSFSLSLKLKANEVWNYVLWPVIMNIDQDRFESNILKLDVFDKILSEWDIKDIHSLWNIFYKLNYIFIILIIFLALFFIYFYKKEDNQKFKNIETLNFLDVFIANLLLFKKEKIDLERTVFYNELWEKFREYFNYIWIENSESLTLMELKTKNIDKKLLNLFEKIYFYEFDNKEEDIKQREKIIDNFIKIIK